MVDVDQLGDEGVGQAPVTADGRKSGHVSRYRTSCAGRPPAHAPGAQRTRVDVDAYPPPPGYSHDPVSVSPSGEKVPR